MAIVKAKQDIIVRRLKDLNRLDEEEWDEEATAKLTALIAKMDEDEVKGAGKSYNTKDYEYNNDTESIDSFDSGFQNTDLGIIAIDPGHLDGEYLPKLRKPAELTVVPIEPIMK